MDEIAQALGLAAGASLAEILAAIKELGTGGRKLGGDGGGGGGNGGYQQGSTTSAQEGATVLKIAAALQLGGGIQDVDGLVAALRKSPAAPEVVTALRQQVDAQQKAIAELTSANQLAAFRAVIHGPEHAGKVPPADEAQYFELFCTRRQLFDTVLANTPTKVREQSLFTGLRRPGGAATPQTEAGWKAEYAKTRELQDEFGDEKAYVAFRQAEAAGQVNILKR